MAEWRALDPEIRKAALRLGVYKLPGDGQAKEGAA